MRQNESLHVVIGANANALSDRKFVHTQGRGRIAHAMQKKHYTGPLIAFVIRIHCSLSDYTQVGYRCAGVQKHRFISHTQQV